MDCLYVRFYRKCEAFFKEKQIRFDILKFLYKVLPVLEAAVYCGLIIYSFVKEDYLMFTKCIVVPATAFVVVSIFRKLIDSEQTYIICISYNNDGILCIFSGWNCTCCYVIDNCNNKSCLGCAFYKRCNCRGCNRNTFWNNIFCFLRGIEL